MLSLADIDHVLTTLHQRHPQIRMVRGEAPPKIEDYTYPDGRIDPVAVSRLFADGLTLVLNQMQRRLPRLAELCRGLEQDTAIAFQANLYLTPPRAGGFKVHYDTHDVFVLQVEGAKEWELFKSPIELPMPGQEHDAAGTAPGAVIERFVLNAGDLLYIPRGIYHQARASETLSLHITLGAMMRRWSEFLIEAIAELSLRDVDFRKSLPMGFATGRFDTAEAKAHFAHLLQRVAASADFEATQQSFAEDFIRARDAVVPGQFLEAIRTDAVSQASVVMLREGAIYSIGQGADGVVVRHLNATIELPGYVGDSLAHVLSGGPVRVSDIAGDLDVPGKLTLARKLIEAGLLRRVV